MNLGAGVCVAAMPWMQHLMWDEGAAALGLERRHEWGNN